MPVRSRRYALPEWSSLPIGDDGISEGQAEQLHLAAIKAARRLGVAENGVLARGFRKLETKQVCGIIAVPGLTLEILPKLADEDGALRATLVRMIAVAFDIPLSEGQIAQMGAQENDLLDVFINLFVTRLSQQVQTGLPRLYVTEDDVLPKLRGTLDVRQQIFTDRSILPACIVGSMSFPRTRRSIAYSRPAFRASIPLYALNLCVGGLAA